VKRKPDEAINLFRKALRFRPDYAECHYNLGLALAGRGSLDEAIGHLRRAAELNPNDADSHLYLATALASRGQGPESIEHFEKALKIVSDRGENAKAEAIRQQIKKLR
jgi:tetratricopeptide (TPR) repeat protein